MNLQELSKAEAAIKLAIFAAFLNLSGELALRARIALIIERIRKMGFDQGYVNGLIHSSNKMITDYYRKPLRQFKKMDLGVGLPKEVFLKSQAKGSVVIQDYAENVKKMMSDLAKEPVVTYEKWKKHIRLWQKAEIDIRHEHNEEMIEKLKSKGEDICYISSHPDCSKRCQRWQGELVSLTEHAKNPGKKVTSPKSSYIVRYLDGKPVYSLPDIMEAVDKYGYHNTIISGFNCRHRLIPYHGQLPPTHYEGKDIKKQRAIEQKIRAMEREIRETKTECELAYADPPKQRQLRSKVKNMVAHYKSFCNEHGYAWQQYRIVV